MHPRTIIVGLAGGLVAGLLTRYPLYIYLPSLYLKDWPAAGASPSATLAWLMLGIALVVILLAGVVGGRLSGLPGRRGGAAGGAVAGTIAALLAHTFYGGAAIGMHATRIIWEHGIHQSATEAEFLNLIAESTLQNIVYGLAAFIAVGLLGLLLGTMGGLLAGGKAAQQDYTSLWLGASVMGVLFSCVVAVVSAAVFGLMPKQISEAAANSAITLSASPWLTVALPVGLYLALLTFFEFTAWLTLRAMLKRSLSEYYAMKITGYILAAAPILLVILMFFVARDVVLQIYALLGLGLAVLFGVLNARLGRQFEPMDKSRGWQVPPPPYSAWMGLTAGSIPLLLNYAITGVSLSIVLLVVTLIVQLAPPAEGAPPPTAGQSAAELVAINYSIQSTTGGLLILGLAVVGAAIGYAVGLFTQWLARRASRPTNAPPPPGAAQ